MNNPQLTSSPKPDRRSGGEILIDGLIKYGVGEIFCVPGESYLAALDALYARQDAVQVITCRQEDASYNGRSQC